MIHRNVTVKRAGTVLVTGVGLLLGQAIYAASFTATPFATGTGVNATGPDSITIGGNSVWVEYGNGANSGVPLGTDGSSTIAQYSYTGTLQKTYTFSGLDDGLRYDPYTNQVWVLQNNDGYSGLTILDPTSGKSTAFTYAVTSPDRGYDDAQFVNGQTYLSYTNPGADPNDTTNAVIVTPTFGPGNVITTTPVLLASQAGNITDPDSLGLTANGSLLLTGEADGTLTTVTNPGPGQTVKVLSLVDAGGNALNNGDDTVFAPAGSPGLLVADPNDNTVYKVQGNFTPGAYYGSVGTTGTVDLIDLGTGLSTPITSGLLPADANPHGLAFLPTNAVPEASPLPLLGLGLVGLLFRMRRKRSLNVSG